MKFLTGITRGDQFIPAEPWSSPAMEQDVSLADRFKGLSEEIERKRREPDEALALGEARQLVETVRVLGFTVALVDERIQVRGSGELSPGTVERLKALREAVVRVLEAER